MNKLFFLLIMGLFLLSLGAGNPESAKVVASFGPEESVYQALQKLGDDPATHIPDFTIEDVSVASGENLVRFGFSLNANGKRKGGRQSKFFVCTTCHNLDKEDPDLRYADPEARLSYVKEKGLPMLQGTTLYGAVNRESFYNGDYEKKYGDLVLKARKDIRQAIQLCATECAQGRELKKWEMESVLAYLWTLELRFKDLNIEEDVLQILNEKANESSSRADRIETLKSYYLQASPATFHEAPEDRKEGFPPEGRPAFGADVYEISCKHCHEKGRYSFFDMDDSKATFRFLDHHFDRYTRYSTYHVTAYGAPSRPGKKAYMPNYTLEKLSLQQIEDLRAFFRSEINSTNK